ncbi:MAG: PQQ-binding-like beta-propeller repeat protein [Thermoguttaceae bacterium]
MKHCVSFLLFLFLLVPLTRGASSQALIPELEAQRYGLTRAWYNQLKIDVRKHRITHVILQDRTLYITTDNGCLHVVDAETGATRWMEMLGEGESRPLAPAANSRMVAVLTGVTLYVFDRQTGKTLWNLRIAGNPIDGVSMSERYVFVPLSNGRIFAWPLEVIEDESTRYKPAKTEEPDNKGESEDEHDRFRAEIQAAVDSAKQAIMKDSVRPKKKAELILEPPLMIPLECQSFGDISFAPTLTMQTSSSDHLVWPSNRGELYLARIGRGERDRFLLQYQIRLAPQSYAFSSYKAVQGEWRQPREVTARPTYRPGMVLKLENDDYYQYVEPIISRDTLDSNLRDETKGAYFTPRNPGGIAEKDLKTEYAEEKILSSMVFAGTIAGVVTAVDGGAGRSLWKYTASRPVVERVAAIKDRVYFCLQDGGMYCLDAETGRESWFRRGPVQFIAESNQYVYGKNRLNEMMILDRETGETKAIFSVQPYERCLFNIESDRIYLITADGLIQCLHERDLVQPLQYRPTSQEIASLLFTTGGFRDATTQSDVESEGATDLFAPSLLESGKKPSATELDNEVDVNPFTEQNERSNEQPTDEAGDENSGDVDLNDMFDSGDNGEEDNPF